MTSALDGYLTRLNGVVTSRVKGPRARKGTRWWGESAKALYVPMSGPGDLETKALDPSYALPDKLVSEVADAARPIALRVAYDTAAHTAAQLGVRVPDTEGGGLFAIDHTALNAAIEAAVGRIMDVAQHHAAVVREAITRADSSADTLDEVLDQIEAAHAKGGNWLRMSGKALANALIQDAALSQARALGSTHAQWLSRRDDHVRETHVEADGQERPIGEKFSVGDFQLAYPCDPTDLPESWDVVAGCRCGLIFRSISEDHRAALRVLTGTRPGQPGPGVSTLLADIAAGQGVREVPTPAGVPLVDGVAPLAHQIVTSAPVVGYRGMTAASTAVAGQWIVLPGATMLGLTAPAIIAEGAPVLAVFIPAGTLLTVAAGMAVLPQGQPLEVLTVSSAGVQARPAQLDSSA